MNMLKKVQGHGSLLQVCPFKQETLHELEAIAKLEDGENILLLTEQNAPLKIDLVSLRTSWEHCNCWVGVLVSFAVESEIEITYSIRYLCRTRNSWRASGFKYVVAVQSLGVSGGDPAIETTETDAAQSIPNTVRIRWDFIFILKPRVIYTVEDKYVPWEIAKMHGE